MKIAAWNLNHRVRLKPVPEAVGIVVGRLSPDVLVLTEFVDSESREDRAVLRQALVDMGLCNMTVSTKRDGHNQVLIASRMPHVAGTVPIPKESHAQTNFLPVFFPDLGVTLVGMRAPAYKDSAQVKSYWEELSAILHSVADQSLVLIGDVNGDPDLPQSIGGRHLRELRDRGWNVPSPKGDWSYVSNDGRFQSRIDHVLASPAIRGVSASYVTEVDGTVIAAASDRKPISDHAILLVEIELAPPKAGEVIVEVLAEGGSVTLYGARTSNGWIFSRDVMDQTPELLDEPWIEHSSSGVDTWPAALELLDQYPWHRLHPHVVHPEFRRAVLEAVEERFRQEGREDHSRLGKWKTLCGGDLDETPSPRS